MARHKDKLALKKTNNMPVIALNNHCKKNEFKDIAKNNFPALMRQVVEKGFLKGNACKNCQICIFFYFTYLINSHINVIHLKLNFK